jgi:putative sigma-54 modulation protein
MMNIKTRAINFDLTDAINDYVNKKLSSLEKFVGGAGEVLCEVELGRTTKHHNNGDVFKAEVNMFVSGTSQVYAVTEQADLYSAIDLVKDDVERQLVAGKSKKETLFRKGAGKIKNLLKSLDFRK